MNLSSQMTKEPKTMFEQKAVKPKNLAALTDRVIFAATLFATALILWIILYPALGNRMYLADDLGTFSIPMRRLYADGLQLGRIDIWMPSLFNGFYVHGEGQVGMFHPLHLLLYRFIPFVQAFGLDLLTSYVLLWTGSCLLFYKWTQDWSAAAFGAFAFSFSGPAAASIVHINKMAVIAHIPWVLFALDGCIRGERQRSNYWLVAVALFNGSVILLGYPFFFGLCLVLQFWYVAYLASEGVPAARVLKGACGIVAGFMVGAIQLLPTLQFLGSSTRSHPNYAFLQMGSLDPLNFFQWANPYLFLKRSTEQFELQEFSIYAGIGPLLLFLWLCTRRRIQQRKLPLFLLGLALVGVFLSLGQYNHVFIYYCRFPVLRLFRMPCRYMLFAMFAIAGGSALALKELKSGPVAAPSTLGKVLVGCLLFVSFITVTPIRTSIPSLSDYRVVLGSEGRSLSGFAIVCICIVLFRYALRFRGWWLTGFCLLAVCDIGIYSGTYLHTLPKGNMGYYKSIAVPVPAPARIVHEQMDDALILAGYSLVNGYAGLEPPNSHSLSNPKYLQAVGATARRDMAGMWTRLTLPPAPEVRFEQPLHLPEHAAASEDIDLTKVAIVSRPVGVDPSATGSVQIIEQHPGFVRLSATSSGRMLCVLVQRFHPGWSAEIDHQRLDLVPVDGEMTGFVFPGGSKEVTLVFQPNDLALGRDITFATLALLAVGVLAQWIRNRRKRPV